MTQPLTALRAEPDCDIADAPAVGRWRRLATRAAIVGAIAGGAWLLGTALGANSASAAVAPVSDPLVQVTSAGPPSAAPVTGLLPVLAQPVDGTLTTSAASLNQTVASLGTVVIATTAPLPAPISDLVAGAVDASTGSVATTTQAVDAALTSATGALTTTVDVATTTLRQATGDLGPAAGALTAAVRGDGPTAAAMSASATVLVATVHRARPIAPVAALAAVAAALAVGVAGIGGAGAPTAPGPTAPGGPAQVLTSTSTYSSAFDRLVSRSWRAVARRAGLILAAAVAAGLTLFYDAPPFSPD